MALPFAVPFIGRSGRRAADGDAADGRSWDADATELQQLVHRSASLSRVAYVLTGDRAEADRILVTVLRDVWRDRDRVRQADGTVAHVRRAVVTRCLDAAESGPCVGGPAAGAAPALHPLHRALLTLPRRQRACVVLEHVGGLTTAQIADVLEVGEPTVARQLARGMAALRSALVDVHATDAAPAAPGVRS